jgi:hypothetical protein
MENIIEAGLEEIDYENVDWIQGPVTGYEHSD